MNSETVKHKSSRAEQCRVKAEKKLKEDLLAKQAAIVPFVDKKQDGLELRRREGSLNLLVNTLVKGLFACAPQKRKQKQESR
jgi:hypothetical protein